MLLGQVLERLGDEGFAAETLVALEDLPLMVEVETAGRLFGESPGEYAAGASRRFAAFYWMSGLSAGARSTPVTFARPARIDTYCCSARQRTVSSR